jgi:hypothetical protein
MDTKPINPLFAHFRQPAIYFKLPSHGHFWESGLDLPANGEIPVYPMTARDEITLRTPDALLNGQGVVDVIQSCCPNITDAWQMPSIDVDSTLIAIRIASYGNEMSLDSTCPHCQEENRFDADLGKILGGITTPDYSQKLNYADLNIKLHPQRYFSANATNQISYEEQRVLMALGNPDLDEETRVGEYKKHMQRLIELNTKILSDSTEYIEIEESNTIVTDKKHIFEFYQNCSGDICKAVRDQLEVLNKQASIPPLEATCQSCTKEYTMPLVFDYASFFATGS